MTFWNKYGRDEAMRVCAEAGTNYDYFKHLAHKRKQPSVKLAKRLEKASGGKITFAAIFESAK
jgi:hypothetical protein